MNEAPLEGMLDLRAVAKLLAIDERSVWRRIAEGKLAKPAKSGRSSRWFVSDVAKFQQRLRDERGE